MEPLKKPKKIKDYGWQGECKYIKSVSNGFFYNPSNPPYVAVDIETTGLNQESDTIVGISLSANAYEGVYYSIQHLNADNLPLKEVIGFLNEVVEKGTTLVYFNAKFDRAFLNKAGLRDEGHFVDVQIELYSTSAHLFQGSSSLKTLFKKVYGLDMMELHELFGISKAEIKRNPPNFATLPVDEKTLAYACSDALATYRLFEYSRSRATDKTKSIAELDHAVVPAIQAMERAGITICPVRLQDASESINEERDKLSAALRAKLGPEVNLGSPKQLRGYFFDKLGLSPLIKTPKDEASTSTTALRALQRRYGNKYKELNWLIQWRKLDTLNKSYIKPISGGIKPGTSKIYPQFKVASLVTGRISSTGDGIYLEKLNFQGIPKNLAQEGFNIRKMFRASPGYRWLSIDLSSIEPRLIANLSEDAELVRIYNTPGEDLYTSTTEYLFKQKPGDSDFQRVRKVTKIIILAMFYSFGVHSIKANLEQEVGEKIREEWVWELREKIEKRFPGWTALRMQQIKDARRLGYAETLWGRKRDLSDLYSQANYLGCAGDRVAVNMPIQGTAADLLRRALIHCNDYIESQPAGEINMLSTVHDEINFEIREEVIDKHLPELVKCMAWTPPGFKVPILAEVEVGPSWGELSKWKGKTWTITNSAVYVDFVRINES